MTVSTVVNNVAIRPATGYDFKWAADLMVQSFSPFRGGDYHVHARRVFDAQMNREGVYQAGFLLGGHGMFLAEQNDKPVGLVHVIEEKRKTVRIGLLAAHPDCQDGLEIRSALLEYAEDYARNLGAVHLYCTVFWRNHKALEFFLKNGFKAVDTVKDHRKRGNDRHVLHKRLNKASDVSQPSLSVVKFDEDKHTDGVRHLIMSEMKGVFRGVDDSWADSLLAAHRLGKHGDVYARRRTILVAECYNQVVGVVGTAPRKGQPISLVPLVAKSEAAFELLLISIQKHLKDHDGEMYVNLAPRPSWQAACIQRHGWTLGGTFPGVARNSYIQRWEFNPRRRA